MRAQYLVDAPRALALPGLRVQMEEGAATATIYMA
jgi:hypothetical protein